MNVTIIVSKFPPKWLAGTEIATYNIAKNLSEKGHEVHVITSLDEEVPTEEYKDGFYIHRIKFSKKPIVGLAYFLYHVFLTTKRVNSDIIHIQSTGNGISGLFANFFLKKPYVVWGQGSDVYLPDMFTKLTSKIIQKNASYVIALTEHMKNEMMKISNSNIIVIPNGVDLDIFKNIPIKQIKKDHHNKIIFVGRLQHVKGVKYLIEAMAIISKNRDVELVVVGDGNDREELELLVEELDLNAFVSFIGEVPNSEVPKYMAEADIFVLPSLSEGFPLVIMEAMASGAVIVATKVGGIPNIIQDNINGLLVEPMNSKDIADKILLLLKDTELRYNISENNRICVEKYDWRQIVTQLESIYVKSIQH